MGLTVNELVAQSHKNSAEHGFWSTARTDETIPSKLALIMSEAAEALEAYRDPKGDDMVPVPSALVVRLCSGPSDSAEYYGARRDLSDLLAKWRAKPKGFASELADIMIRVGDLAGGMGIDLEAAVAEKHEYNRSREHMHGRRV